jgi:hypothetical protein
MAKIVKLKRPASEQQDVEDLEDDRWGLTPSSQSGRAPRMQEEE